MQSTTSTDLFRYWQNARGEEDAPLRNRIEPDRIRHLLGDVFILEADLQAKIRFRLAGTRICALFGRELRGMTFDSLWPASELEGMAEQAAETMARRRPTLVRATGLAGGERHLPVELLLLPMRARTQAVDRIFGALAPLERPAWIGFDPLHFLSVDRISYPARDNRPVGARSAPARATGLPRENPLSQAVRRVRHLAVLDGGRRD